MSFLMERNQTPLTLKQFFLNNILVMKSQEHRHNLCTKAQRPFLTGVHITVTVKLVNDVLLPTIKNNEIDSGGYNTIHLGSSKMFLNTAVDNVLLPTGTRIKDIYSPADLVSKKLNKSKADWTGLESF